MPNYIYKFAIEVNSMKRRHPLIFKQLEIVYKNEKMK